MITDKNIVLNTFLHYSEVPISTSGERDIFGEFTKDSNISYDYDDRLMQYDREKSEMAWKKTIQDRITPKTARFYEAYLSYYYDKKIDLKNIRIGVNRSSGFSYLVFGFIATKIKKGE